MIFKPVLPLLLVALVVSSCGTDTVTEVDLGADMSQDLNNSTSNLNNPTNNFNNLNNPTNNLNNILDMASDEGSDLDPQDQGTDSSIDADMDIEDTGVDADADMDTTDSGTDADMGVGLEPGPGDLVIVEIQGNPQMITDEQGEYIELLNVSGRALDLQGVTLAHVDWEGGEPVVSFNKQVITQSVPVAIDARVLLTRSNGGFLGGATGDYVYSGFLFSNGGARLNRLRIMAPGWNQMDPPAAGFLIDEIKVPAGGFDNPLRAQARQLKPAVVATPATNDVEDNWCYTESSASLEYRTNNWGTPGGTNRCN